MLLDTQQERLQERFDQLRADGQLCPCNCADCPLRQAAEAIDAEAVPVRTHDDVAREMIDLANQIRPLPEGPERDELLAQWHTLTGESAAFIRARNEEFCRQHPEKCLP